MGVPAAISSCSPAWPQSPSATTAISSSSVLAAHILVRHPQWGQLMSMCVISSALMGTSTLFLSVNWCVGFVTFCLRVYRLPLAVEHGIGLDLDSAERGA